MSEYYFLNQGVVTFDNLVSLGSIESDHPLEPVNLLNGAKLTPEPSYINIKISESGGDLFPDVFNVLITLFSNKVKTRLDKCGIDNIDYYPVKLINAKNNRINSDYWFANICGRISCLDVENSDAEEDVFGTGYDFKSFCIDESRTMGAEIFRLHEDGTLIILHERIYSALAEVGLKGVVMKNTREYDGHGI
ncbi:MAG: hypothetical protein OEZ39_14070 [Gammaproteobacteria bacterium]|nr:hypothetical protein [Gammaproteobacteria bacterium]MDH5652978.1 hypothetical protein [Gammaproteobacteria bacterium]